MTMIRAKFRVSEVRQSDAGYAIMLHPVVGGSPENDQFFRFTPSGQIALGTINEKAAQAFTVGRQFYIDFHAADEVTIDAAPEAQS